jgi:cytochrome c oxidase accessory protein FixG
MTEATTQRPPAHPRTTVPGTRFHRVRKTIQSICFAIFVILPLFDVMRVDLPRQRFYFFGAELWISEFSIIFLTMMFLWILVAAMAMIYGRFWCGYLCPQMIFSETANALEKYITRFVNRRLPGSTAGMRRFVAIALFSAALLPASVFVTFVFVAYFVPPADLVHRLLQLDMRTAGGIVGASVTLVTFIDFAFLRQRFCTAICPYGYLQNMLADKHTLLVLFQDAKDECIQCNKCVRACPMGIDIRQSSHQLECTHCAECIDACSGILGKLGRQPLIRYAWGDTGSAARLPWFRRIGFRDGKRIAVLVLLLVYAGGLSIAISMRQPVLVRIMPNRSTLYNVDSDGLVRNRFRVLASNRGHRDAALTLTLSGLDGAAIVDMPSQIRLKPGETLQREFDVAVAPGVLRAGVNRMSMGVEIDTSGKPLSFAETFFAPADLPGK